MVNTNSLYTCSFKKELFYVKKGVVLSFKKSLLQLN